MLARPDRKQPTRTQGLQERLQTIIGAQVVQIAALQAQMEEMQAELERLKKPSEAETIQ